MVARSKLYVQLELLENELREKLILQLKSAIKGDDSSIFCVEKFSNHKEWKGRFNKNTEYLVGLGAQILTLKKKLGESSENSIAEQICLYCRRWNDNVHAEPKYAQILANEFLDKIESSVYH